MDSLKKEIEQEKTKFEVMSQAVISSRDYFENFHSSWYVSYTPDLMPCLIISPSPLKLVFNAVHLDFLNCIIAVHTVEIEFNTILCFFCLV